MVTVSNTTELTAMEIREAILKYVNVNDKHVEHVELTWNFDGDIPAGVKIKQTVKQSKTDPQFIFEQPKH